MKFTRFRFVTVLIFLISLMGTESTGFQGEENATKDPAGNLATPVQAAAKSFRHRDTVYALGLSHHYLYSADANGYLALWSADNLRFLASTRVSSRRIFSLVVDLPVGENGPPVEGVTAGPGRVFLGGEDSRIYSLTVRKNQVREKKEKGLPAIRLLKGKTYPLPKDFGPARSLLRLKSFLMVFSHDKIARLDLSSGKLKTFQPFGQNGSGESGVWLRSVFIPSETSGPADAGIRPPARSFLAFYQSYDSQGMPVPRVLKGTTRQPVSVIRTLAFTDKKRLRPGKGTNCGEKSFFAQGDGLLSAHIIGWKHPWDSLLAEASGRSESVARELPPPIYSQILPRTSTAEVNQLACVGERLIVVLGWPPGVWSLPLKHTGAAPEKPESGDESPRRIPLDWKYFSLKNKGLSLVVDYGRKRLLVGQKGGRIQVLDFQLQSRGER